MLVDIIGFIIFDLVTHMLDLNKDFLPLIYMDRLY